MSEIEVSFTDLERAIANHDSQLPELLSRYLEQDDPEPGAPEVMTPEQLDAKLKEREESRSASDDDDDDDGDDDDVWNDWPSVADDAFTFYSLRQAVAPYAMRRKTATERKLARLEGFARAEKSPHAPPRLRLGTLLLALYERGDELGRTALLTAFTKGELGWGIWKAAKGIYKRAEASFDFEMLGALAYRFDAMSALPYKRGEMEQGTMVYLRRRAWRFLRLLGAAVPDAYPMAAVEVLRHYPSGHRHSTWVAGHIFAHRNMRHATSPVSFSAPGKPDACAFPETWKSSPAPLLRLLELSENGQVCKFAIGLLRAHHALALRAVELGWLERLGRRSVTEVQSFAVALLKDNPELHQSKLRQLGLHDMVLGLLRSSADDARTYALEYARTYATDVPVQDWISLVETGHPTVRELAVARLEPVAGAAITLPGLVRLLLCAASAELAVRKIKESFTARDLDADLFLSIASGDKKLQQFLVELYNTANLTIPTEHWKHAIEKDQVTRWALQELGKRKAADIGVAWICAKLEVAEYTEAISRWLDAGMLAGPQLDVEWVRSLVAKPRLRALALRLLSNRELLAPSRVGLSWLLELARSADEELAQFAQRFLLGNFAPEDFADAATQAGPAGAVGAPSAGSAATAGRAQLWALLAGASQPEPVRLFAASYLKAHHPTLGPEQAEVKSLGLTPRLGHDDYPRARLQPLFDDSRADVRRFAVSIAKEELVRWGDPGLLYTMAASLHREPRAAACELLLGMGGAPDQAADPDVIPASWLDGRRLFALAESPHKATRETALTLIRRTYDRVGGAERLGWLMESSEREVRLFAVRLFWDRHRPRALPEGFVPAKDTGANLGCARFADPAALRQFVRDVLFGLPPGRMEKRDDKGGDKGAAKSGDQGAKGGDQGAKSGRGGRGGRGLPERALPASLAKARLIETLRLLAVEDREFAGAVAPVFGEFVHSQAKGERHAALAALVAVRAAYPDLGELGLPRPVLRSSVAAQGGHRG